MDFQTGQRTGNYEILEELDQARTGHAYKVRNTLIDRTELLRVLAQEGDREVTDRFLREIRVHAKLVHPNIVTFYNAAELDGQLVMTTEHVEGETLEVKMEARPVMLNDSVRWIIEVLSALAYAHEHGIIHREISPANILISRDGHAKLSGFGLAKGVGDPQLTQVGTIMGWIEYMAPEQIQGTPLDARTDLYSVGAVLYELVTGQVPFICESQFDLMLAHVQRQPSPPLEVRPELPADLSSIILTALEKDPEKRFHNATAFRTALETVSTDIPPPAAFADPTMALPATPLPEPAIRPLAVDPVELPDVIGRPGTASVNLTLVAVVTFVAVLLIFYLYLRLTRG
ncbi:MAG: serine/threonine protein kinase [Bryobacteraceae bacterium]